MCCGGEEKLIKISELAKICGTTTHTLRYYDSEGVLCADHVDVALQNDGGSFLVTGGGLLDDDDVVQVVLIVFQTPLPGKAHQPVAGLLGVAGAVGIGAKLLKKAENALGFQMFQNCHDGTSSITSLRSR